MNIMFQSIKTVSFLALVTMSLVSLCANTFLPDCKSDSEKFCKGITQPKAKVTQCLLEHTDDLSDGCKADLKIYSEKMRNQTKGVCKEDVDKFCKWTVPGGGRIIKCLFKNESNLSESCKKILNE